MLVLAGSSRSRLNFSVANLGVGVEVLGGGEGDLDRLLRSGGEGEQTDISESLWGDSGGGG